MRPRAIVFDWDNTLVDSWVCIQESYNMTFRHFAMPEWSMAETQANVAKSLRDSFPSMFGDRWEEARDVFYRAFEAIHLDFLRPLDDTETMLHRLKEAGIYLAVVSNKRGAFLRKEAEVLGWTSLFGALVGAADAARDKPDPAPVSLALAPSGQAPGPLVWFVGDAPVDTECGVRSGCVPVLLRRHPPVASEFLHPPVHHFGTGRELADLVLEHSVPISGD